MNDFVYRIKNSQPTKTGDVAKQIFAEMLQSGKYVVILSEIIGMEDALKIGEIFVSAIASIDMKEFGNITSFQPIHTLQWQTDENVPVPSRHYGLMYSNGFVLYSEGINDPDYQVMGILMEREVAGEYGFEIEKVII